MTVEDYLDSARTGFWLFLDGPALQLPFEPPPPRRDPRPYQAIVIADAETPLSLSHGIARAMRVYADLMARSLAIPTELTDTFAQASDRRYTGKQFSFAV